MFDHIVKWSPIISPDKRLLIEFVRTSLIEKMAQMQKEIIDEGRWLCTLKQELSIAKHPVNASICLYAWFKASSKTGRELLFGLVWMGRVMLAAGVKHAATLPSLLSVSLLLSPSVFVSQLLSHCLSAPPLNKEMITVNMSSSLHVCFPLSTLGGVSMNFLSFKAPELVEFDTIEKKVLYYTSTEWDKVRFLVEFIIQEAASGHCICQLTHEQVTSGRDLCISLQTSSALV